ncbi:hypothetical protein P0Y35_04250 [Kiritimatiellaeota bacterium B1221]|nr:hypothetical protein [Kiritimatiellaeota bacterium B1221]
MKYFLAILTLGLLIGCGQQEEPTVNNGGQDPRPIVIMKDGSLMFDSNPMSEAELVTMIKELVEKDYNSESSSQHATVILEAEPETSADKIDRIKKLIRANGGFSDPEKGL